MVDFLGKWPLSWQLGEKQAVLQRSRERIFQEVQTLWTEARKDEFHVSEGEEEGRFDRKLMDDGENEKQNKKLARVRSPCSPQDEFQLCLNVTGDHWRILY